MKYEKSKAEVLGPDELSFITGGNEENGLAPHEMPQGYMTCGTYDRGGYCLNISWGNGYSCGSYTNGHCQSIFSPPGSQGDGCNMFSLTCPKF